MPHFPPAAQVILLGLLEKLSAVLSLSTYLRPKMVHRLKKYQEEDVSRRIGGGEAEEKKAQKRRN